MSSNYDGLMVTLDITAVTLQPSKASKDTMISMAVKFESVDPLLEAGVSQFSLNRLALSRGEDPLEYYVNWPKDLPVKLGLSIFGIPNPSWATLWYLGPVDNNFTRENKTNTSSIQNFPVKALYARKYPFCPEV
jgi:hypothetical protein